MTQPAPEKDCLGERYQKATLVTQHSLELNRLNLLRKCLTLKRPIQSLRARGLNGLPEDQARSVLQEVETKATLRAIENKRRDINILHSKILNLKRNQPWSRELIKDSGLIHIQQKKLSKKIAFMIETEDTKFGDWKKKKCASRSVDQHNEKVSAMKLGKKMEAKKKTENKLQKKLAKRAKNALERNLVVNLTSLEIPAYSIAVLSYGPGWIPCPRFDADQFKLDGFNAGNKLGWKAIFKGSEHLAPGEIPSKLLKKQVTSPCLQFKDPAIRAVKDDAANFVENFKPKNLQSNMNRYEREGWNWLNKSVRNGTIAITSADKGGALIIMTPDMIKDITETKVSDSARYRPLDTDPTPELRRRLLDRWESGYGQGFVTAEQSKKVVGLIPKPDGSRSQSTSDNTKPGTPYGYPLPKIHKLSPEELKQKKIPPSRFVTDLSQGVTARSDTFLVGKWLGSLARDYCSDLVQDSTEALIKLEELVAGNDVGNDWFSVSIDIVSLYDSLRHELVMDALDDAMDYCRQDWSDEFKAWLKGLIKLSFEAAVLKNRDQWYAVVNGVPTGGINSVDCGNIALFYVLKKLVYAPDKRPRNLMNMDRFVDDISGQAKGDIKAFEKWVESLRIQMVAQFGLDLTFEIKPITQFTQFLDINYKIVDGKLTTDVFRKATDANRYLEFSSYHPKHTFRSIVFSQALRYRRIINEHDLLRQRLDELKGFFVQSSYPLPMLNEVIEEVKRKPRELGYRQTDGNPKASVPWIITYGAGHTETKTKVAELNRKISSSRTWCDEAEHNIPHFRVVTRRAPNTKDILFRRRAMALGSGSSRTKPCTEPGRIMRGRKCQTCKMVSGSSTVKNNDVTVSAKGGDCKTRNIVYAATCKLCPENSVYVGKTVTTLSQRVNAHRSQYYKILEKKTDIRPEDIEDENVLGAHIFVKHKKRNKTDFDDCFLFDILTTCSPDSLRKNEQSYIDRLSTLYPFGLNCVRSVSSC